MGRAEKHAPDSRLRMLYFATSWSRLNQQIIMKQSLSNIPSTCTLPVPLQTTHRCCLWAIMSELESKWPNQPYASLIYWPQYKLYYSNYRKEHKQVNHWSRDSSRSGKPKKRKRKIAVCCESLSMCKICHSAVLADKRKLIIFVWSKCSLIVVSA